MTALPLFPVTGVGSWPRSRELLRAQRQRRAGELSDAAFDRLADEAVLRVLELQTEAGVDIVTDGAWMWLVAAERVRVSARVECRD